MTYRGSGKQNSPEMDAMKLHETRTGSYLAKKRRTTVKKQQEELFNQNAPKNPARRFFYNMEKRRLEK